MNPIDYLKTLPENSGQIVEMETINGPIKFYFMWFYTDTKIDLKPIGSIGIYCVHKRNWDKIKLVF